MKVWFITGASSGFGRAIAPAALGDQAGDPARAAAAILRALDAERPPLRLPLGPDAVDPILGRLDRVRDEVLAWEDVSRRTTFADAP